jgi:hypothetical protein
MAGSASAGIQGRLYQYKPSPGSLQAFESPGRHNFRKYCIFVGGLTDGLLACAYVEALAAECEKQAWALVQPVLSSSYKGRGFFLVFHLSTLGDNVLFLKHWLFKPRAFVLLVFLKDMGQGHCKRM